MSRPDGQQPSDLAAREAIAAQADVAAAAQQRSVEYLCTQDEAGCPIHDHSEPAQASAQQRSVVRDPDEVACDHLGATGARCQFCGADLGVAQPLPNLTCPHCGAKPGVPCDCEDDHA